MQSMNPKYNRHDKTHAILKMYKKLDTPWMIKKAFFYIQRRKSSLENYKIEQT